MSGSYAMNESRFKLLREEMARTQIIKRGIVDKEIILDFKRRKNILSSNSINDVDFKEDVSLKNPIINALLNKKKI